MRRRWFPVLLALAPLFLAACSTTNVSSGGSGTQATGPAQGQKVPAPAAPAGNTVLFTDPAVRQTLPHRFVVSFTGEDGLLMKEATPDGLKTVGSSRTQRKWWNGNLITDPNEVGFAATGLVKTCVGKIAGTR